ncbi:MAG TPA: phosphotransferase [Mycobacteriales bacterium]|nr:phosphotransferase [Mycobacteriales bacterium]
MTDDVDPSRVAAAFALDQPVGAPVRIQERGPVLAWRIDTGAGPVLIKRFWAETDLPWRDQLEQAMRIEQLAVAAGIDSPPPITPRDPLFGSVAGIEGLGLFRAFRFIEHRPLRDSDDIAEWVGTTLARTHRLIPLESPPEPNYWYGQHPPVPPEQWGRWVESGTARGNSWADALRENHDLVVDLAARVTSTFATATPHVISHRDFEPWNVLVPLDGAPPMLIDWDTAGPESAPLEAAFAFARFGPRGREDPDPAWVRRAHAAYVAAGGPPLTGGPGILDRMVGSELAAIAAGIGDFFDMGVPDDRTRDLLERLPATVARIRRWEGIFAQL